MIGISKLYCGTIEASDPLRYGRDSRRLPSHLLQFSEDKKPVVVWNVTRRCNLKCIHCYSHSENKAYGNELTIQEGEALLEDLSSFGAPVILFSGGEPFMRKDIFRLASFASDKGMRTVFSTNGTLISKEIAKKLRQVNLSYVGISLDGLEQTNDKFRGVKGAFENALRGIRNCQDEGLKVGLRLTITKRNYRDIPGIFELLEAERISRVCFYHLVYAGRGTILAQEDLDHQQTRSTVDLIIDKTKDLHDRGLSKEVLTVDNHADGPYLYLRMVREKSPRASEVLELLKMNEGNSSGVGIGCVDEEGYVHADQFWRHYSFGNVKDRSFSSIWIDISTPLMVQLKNKKLYVKGRCAKCRWLEICGGNFRVRAEALTGDVWTPDPACYLTDEEIGYVLP